MIATYQMKQSMKKNEKRMHVNLCYL